MNLEEDSFQKYKMVEPRQTAYIVGIDEINKSTYTKSEGEWEPNYVTIRGIKVSRVNLIGVVISASGEENIKSFVIDDGQSNIQVRIFDPLTLQVTVEIGDIVMVIGRPREYNNEKYIAPEIVKHIKDETWLKVRKKQLSKIKPLAPIQQETPATLVKEEVKPTPHPGEIKVEEDTVVEETPVTDAKSIFNLIKELDLGDGADIEEVISKSNNVDCEKIITGLLHEGEIFEVKPGRVKVLE